MFLLDWTVSSPIDRSFRQAWDEIFCIKFGGRVIKILMPFSLSEELVSTWHSGIQSLRLLPQKCSKWREDSQGRVGLEASQKFNLRVWKVFV